MHTAVYKVDVASDRRRCENAPRHILCSFSHFGLVRKKKKGVIIMNEDFMKEKPILPLLTTMALPMVISMLVNSLYNIIDSLFVAKISEDAMTALSLVYPVQNFINAVAIGFGVGINALISFHLGAKEGEKANIAATHGFFFSILHGVILTIGSIALIPTFLSRFTTDSNVLKSGVEYANIVFVFSIIIMMNLTFEKVFQSVGRMNVSMIGLMLGCIANIILDPLLIFGIGFFPKMGMRGAALATGIGQLLTLIFYLFAYFLRPISVRISRKYLILDKHLDLKLYGIGIPAILNLALPSLLISFLNGLLAAYDQCYVVVVGIYYKLQTFLYLPANGIIQGMRPLVGFNYGAGEIKRVKKIYHLTLCMNGVIMLLGMIICFTASPYLIGMFTDNATTISAGSNALRIICCGFLISTVSITASGALEGLSKGGQSLIISLLRYILFIIPLAFVLCKAFGPQYVFHAFWITEILTAAIAALLMNPSLRLPGTQA